MTILPEDSQVYRCFADLIRSADRVFFAGLPGVGKSLLLQQLTLMALAAGRAAHLVQWDTARQPFESPRYPLDQGATHPMVIKAAGTWLRRALLDWDYAHSQANAILIGELPLIGGRFMEIVRPADDEAEPLLADSAHGICLARTLAAGARPHRASARSVHRQASARKRSPGRAARSLTRALAGSLCCSPAPGPGRRFRN